MKGYHPLLWPLYILTALNKFYNAFLGLKVAGQTTEFVNKILEKTKLGARRGGLDEL